MMKLLKQQFLLLHKKNVLQENELSKVSDLSFNPLPHNAAV